jgi:HEAT repeat protein
LKTYNFLDNRGGGDFICSPHRGVAQTGGSSGEQPEGQRFKFSQLYQFMRGQALWALGELRIKEAATRMKDFLQDEGEIWYYGNEATESKKISMIAEEALKKLATP